jgi:hypothetical protein
VTVRHCSGACIMGCELTDNSGNPSAPKHGADETDCARAAETLLNKKGERNQRVHNITSSISLRNDCVSTEKIEEAFSGSY